MLRSAVDVLKLWGLVLLFVGTLLLFVGVVSVLAGSMIVRRLWLVVLGG